MEVVDLESVKVRYSAVELVPVMVGDRSLVVVVEPLVAKLISSVWVGLVELADAPI